MDDRNAPATKGDLAKLDEKIEQSRAEVKQDIEQLRSEFRHEFDDLRETLRDVQTELLRAFYSFA